MQERIRRLQLLTEACRAMSAILDLDRLLDRILGLVNEVFDFSNCAVLLLDPTANELFILKACGYSEEVVRSFRASPGTGVTGAVLEHGEPVVVRDVSQDPRYIPGVPGARGEIAAPLVVDELIIGVLDAETSEPADFTEEDIQFFYMFASQAARAIHNAQLHYRLALHSRILERRLEQIGELLACSQLLTEGGDTEETIRTVVNGAAKAMSCDSCSLLLRSRGNEELHETCRVGPALLTCSTLPIHPGSQGIGRVLREGEPVALEMLSEASEPYEGFPQEGSAMMAPLLRKGEVIGLLVGHCSLGDPPSEMDLALFAGFGTILALSEAARPA